MQNKWTEELYKELITMVYKGFTGEAIGEKFGITGGGVSYALNSIKLTIYKIRKLKRAKTPLAAIIAQADFSSINNKAERMRESALRATKIRMERKAQNVIKNDDITELLKLVRELHDLWFADKSEKYTD